MKDKRKQGPEIRQRAGLITTDRDTDEKVVEFRFHVWYPLL
jgi:hypothetical protein